MRDWVITGTRHGYPQLDAALDYWVRRSGGPFRLLVGDHVGVDTQALSWAESRGIPCVKFEADWGRWGNSAGPRRNAEMVRSAMPGATCFAFPAHDSKGTWDCIRRASKAGLAVVVMPPADSKGAA